MAIKHIVIPIITFIAGAVLMFDTVTSEDPNWRKLKAKDDEIIASTTNLARACTVGFRAFVNNDVNQIEQSLDKVIVESIINQSLVKERDVILARIKY